MVVGIGKMIVWLEVGEWGEKDKRCWGEFMSFGKDLGFNFEGDGNVLLGFEKKNDIVSI